MPVVAKRPRQMTTMRLPPDLLADLGRLAAKEGLFRSELVERVLREHVTAVKQEEGIFS